MCEFDEVMATKKRRKRSKKTKAGGFSDRARQAVGVLLILAALLTLISLVSHTALDDRRITGEVDSHLAPMDIAYRNQGGMIGAYLSFVLMIMLGWLSFFIPVALGLGALRLFAADRANRWRFNAILLATISLLVTMMYNVHLLARSTLGGDVPAAGGYVGHKLTELSIKLVGGLGSYVMLGGMILLLLVLYTSITPMLSKHLRLPGGATLRRLYGAVVRGLIAVFSFGWLPSFGSSDDDEEEEDEEYDEQVNSADGFERMLSEQVKADKQSATDLATPGWNAAPSPKARRKATITPPVEPVKIGEIDYSFPPIDCLSRDPDPGPAVSDDELKFTAGMLKETLETFGVSISGEIERYPGPVITRYEFKPAAGIKVNQIINLSDDLALALKAKRIRIIAPVPGKAAVGVEIPNRKAKIVYLRDVLESPEFTNSKMRLPLALGKTTSGKPYVTDLAKLPHLLIAGATGSGKSVCMNVLVTSLIYRLHPHHIRFIMVDPKMLELSIYAGIPHLGRPVITNPKRAEKVLADAVVEMEARYRKLANASVRNIEDYNKRQESDDKKLPYIVIMVDELADLLMSTSSAKTELLITRLAQMARAVGIHLVLATQRPSVDVITGLIKANFPARLAFAVSSKVDSRTILDANGAEKLLGAGDMLFLHPGQPEATRLHGPYVTSEETEQIVKIINDQNLPMLTLENISQATGETTEAEDIDYGDPLFKEACEVVVRHKQGSVSLLQRRLGIGYQRAARLIDKLEQAGIVSTFDGSKAREVLVDKPYIDMLFAQGASVPAGETEAN